jgi:type VI secretion system Hcp family effector
MAIYMDFKGKVQGSVKGDVTAAGYKDQIIVTSVEFGIGRPTDQNTGLASGRQVYRKLTVTKVVDKSSPLLLTASANNESATINLSYVAEGATHKNFVSVNLTGCMVQDFNHMMFDDGSRVEKLLISYQTLEYTWKDGGITASLDVTGTSQSP